MKELCQNSFRTYFVSSVIPIAKLAAKFYASAIKNFAIIRTFDCNDRVTSTLWRGRFVN